jgi:hypothetical protein
MKPDDLESISVDGLWSLHEQVVSILTRRYLPKEQGLNRDCARLARVQPLGLT